MTQNTEEKLTSSSDSIDPSSQAVSEEDVERSNEESNEQAVPEEIPTDTPEGRSSYIVICVTLSEPPQMYHAFTKADVKRIIRDIRNRNENQYLYVIRGGELGQLFRTRRGLLVKFNDEQLKIANQLNPVRLEDGWIGEGK